MLNELNSVTQLYTIASQCRLGLEGVHDARFAALTWSVDRMRRASDDANDPTLTELARQLGLLCARLASSPLPSGHRSVKDGIDFDDLEVRAREMDHAYGRVFGAGATVDLSRAIVAEDGQPLGDRVIALRGEHPVERLLLIPLGRGLRDPTATWARLALGPQVRVGDLSTLRTDNQYDRVVIIGPTSWVRPHAVDAPRTSSLHVLSYSWLLRPSIVDQLAEGSFGPRTLGTRVRFRLHPRIDAPTPRPTIAAPPERATVAPDTSGLRADQTVAGWTTGIGTGANVAEPFAWTAEQLWSGDELKRIVDTIRREDRPTIHDGVRARLIVLVENHAAFLESSDARVALVIDEEDPKGADIRQVRERDVLPGMYLILRVNSSKNYIEEVADGLLGEMALGYRRELAAWKQMLRIRAMGRDAGQLQRFLGLPEGNLSEQDVRRWGSPLSLGPKRREVMLAIASATSRSESADQLWTGLEKLRAAHGRAGQVVKMAFKRAITPAFIEALREGGSVRVPLAEYPEVELAAFRVQAKSPDTTLVVADRLEVPFPVSNPGVLVKEVR